MKTINREKAYMLAKCIADCLVLAELSWVGIAVGEVKVFVDLQCGDEKEVKIAVDIINNIGGRIGYVERTDYRNYIHLQWSLSF